MSSISICILATSDLDSDWRFWVFIGFSLAFYYVFNNWYAKRRRLMLTQLAPTMGFLWLDTMPETPLRHCIPANWQGWRAQQRYEWFRGRL